MVLPRYPEGQIKKRTEGIITIGSATFVDPTIYTVGLLAENWDPTHVDNQITIVDRERVWAGINYGNEDYVLVAPLPGSESPVGIGYSHTHETIRLQILLLSRGMMGQVGPPVDMHFLKLYNEVRRIILAHRTVYFRGVNNAKLGGVAWCKFATMTSPKDKIEKGHIRRTVDLEIRRRWIPINTSWGV